VSTITLLSEKVSARRTAIRITLDYAIVRGLSTTAIYGTRISRGEQGHTKRRVGRITLGYWRCLVIAIPIGKVAVTSVGGESEDVLP